VRRTAVSVGTQAYRASAHGVAGVNLPSDLWCRWSSDLWCRWSAFYYIHEAVGPGRTEKTVEKTRRGRLPKPTDDMPSVEAGNGKRCSGCSETIEPLERLYFVHVHRVALLRFHDVCYNAWATFTR